LGVSPAFALACRKNGVEPGKTDLSFYPLLYWPIGADAQPLSREQAAALNDYMSRGGIILLDTRDSGSGTGFAPGTGSALQRVAQGLVIPPLAPLTTEHVLARAFYLLQDFPGLYTGESVWVQRDQDRTNVALVTALDNTVSAVGLRYHARVADAFGAFFAASANSPFLAHVPCFAGLQVVVSAGPPPQCDIHPSAAGHAVFTQAILAVLPQKDDD